MTFASVFAFVNGLLPETSCRKKTMLSDTQFSVDFDPDEPV
jgi:hypothetical protein